jgi:hypothetical protein
MTQLKQNWRRILASLDPLGLARLALGLHHLQTWQRLDHSCAAWAAVLLFMYAPNTVAAAGLLLLSWKLWRVRQGISWHVLQQQQQLATGGRGDAADDEQQVPAGGMAELRRRYDALLGVALQVQNGVDDVACLLERMQHALSWTDATATALLLAALVGISAAVWLLGLGRLLGLGAMYTLRPPVLRDPLPARPANFFGRLPTRAAGQEG